VCACAKTAYAEALTAVPAGSPLPDRDGKPGKLTIAEAKEGLAATFGVSPDAIEINIRG
jgi:hypothetical protein